MEKGPPGKPQSSSVPPAIERAWRRGCRTPQPLSLYLKGIFQNPVETYRMGMSRRLRRSIERFREKEVFFKSVSPEWEEVTDDTESGVESSADRVRVTSDLETESQGT